MITHICSIVRNDEYILPYFIRHYSTFADKIFIIDDHSTDNTVEVALLFPKVELLHYEYDGGFNEDNFNYSLENNYIKHSRGIADWVMCVDSDEFIYHKDMHNILKEQRENGVRVLKTEGFMMISKTLPNKEGQIYDESKEGIPMRQYGKTVIFDPNIDISFGHGRHSTFLPVGIKAKKVGIKLLHYRCLSRDYFITRSEHLYDRANYDEKTKNYRMKRGLAWYDRSLKANLTNVID